MLISIAIREQTSTAGDFGGIDGDSAASGSPLMSILRNTRKLDLVHPGNSCNNRQSIVPRDFELGEESRLFSFLRMRTTV